MGTAHVDHRVPFDDTIVDHRVPFDYTISVVTMGSGMPQRNLHHHHEEYVNSTPMGIVFGGHLADFFRRIAAVQQTVMPR